VCADAGRYRRRHRPERIRLGLARAGPLFHRRTCPMHTRRPAPNSHRPHPDRRTTRPRRWSRTRRNPDDNLTCGYGKDNTHPANSSANKAPAPQQGLRAGSLPASRGCHRTLPPRSRRLCKAQRAAAPILRQQRPDSAPPESAKKRQSGRERSSA
jgi:hypothetical protein